MSMFNFFNRKKTEKPADAEELHREARGLGQAGKYDAAIEKLKAAILLKPQWAYPYYDLAFTYFLKGDSAQALEYYRKTDALEPRGFFTAKTAIYALEGESSGRFPKGVYSAYMQIEWADDRGRKLAIAKGLAEKVPDFAPAWKEVAVLTNDAETQLHAIVQGLGKDPDAETKGVLLINKALLLHANGKQAVAKEIVEKLIADPESTNANVGMAKFVLGNFEGR